jgi:translation initiation factor 5B
MSKPAIIGIRVISGEIRPQQSLMRDDGKTIGKIKSIQSEKKAIPRAIQGQEVAIAVDGPTVGRQIKPEQIFYTDISEKDVKKLMDSEISPSERDLLEKILKIKKKR